MGAAGSGHLASGPTQAVPGWVWGPHSCLAVSGEEEPEPKQASASRAQEFSVSSSSRHGAHIHYRPVGAGSCEGTGLQPTPCLG